MVPDIATLQEMSYLLLRQDAGEQVESRDKALCDLLLKSPIKLGVLMTQKNACESQLFDICSEMNGEHESVQDLRHRIASKWISSRLPKQWSKSRCLLTALFDGIYVGWANDLLVYRRSKDGQVLYPITGMGEKIADVFFVR